jgi:transposase
MSNARLVLLALFVKHQSAVEVAERYGVHRAWVYELKARYEAEGDIAFAAAPSRSRPPGSLWVATWRTRTASPTPESERSR